MMKSYSKIFSACILLLVSYAFTQRASAQENNGWTPLAKRYSLQDLAKIIIPREKWKPYPSVREPQGFAVIPEPVKRAYIKEGESLLNAKWPRLPATTFLEFKRNGNRTDYENLSFKRRQMLAKLVLAEAFERKGRFIDQIVNGIWAICEESFWGVPAHMYLQKAGPGLPDVQDPVVDLFAAETAQEMAWTYYLLKPELDKVSPLIARRIVYEARRRIFIPYLAHYDWGYLGFGWRKHPDRYGRVNNWNPWINSNVLSAALVLAQNPAMRLKLIHKTMDSIDNFVIPYPGDGGSDEGPEYWGRAAGSLVDYLEILKSASGGEINYFNQPVVRKMGQYIYKMYISYPYFANYGDADAMEYPDPALLYRFGTDTGDSVLTHFAAFEYRKQQAVSNAGNNAADKENQSQADEPGTGALSYPFGALNRALPALMTLADIQKTKPEQPLLRDAWLPDIQVMTARSEKGSTSGFYLMAKAGNNGASHNHNDIGNYIVYYNGDPVLVDAGAQTYTAETFSSRRYDIWNNQSRYHNLPDINGFTQHDGKQFKATDVIYREDNRKAVLRLDLAKAYPDSAHVNTWMRTITLNRGKDVVINEDYTLDKYVKSGAENFLTPCKPDLHVPGRIALSDARNGHTCYIVFDAHKFKPVVEVVTINDQRMTKNWGHTLYHIVLHCKDHHLHDRWTFKIVS